MFFAVLFILTAAAFPIVLLVQSLTNKDKPATPTTSQAVKPEAKVDDPSKLKGKQLEGFTPIPKIETLASEDLKVGDGEEVKKGATLTVDYTGAVASTGKIFESSKDSGKPATFPLGQVIKGWQDGLPGAKVGSVRRLLIPAEQAYGAQSPSPDIPANSDLVFDITVISIK